MVAVERRKDLDPHPPPNIPERRCSDESCMRARQAWYEDTLLPKITNMFWRGVAATIFACMGGLFFIVKSLVDQHTLEMERRNEGKFVTVEMHKEDVGRLEKKLDSIENKVIQSMEDFDSKLDRNLSVIREVHKR